ncbi:MAG: hypothetical protein RR424_10835 [Oscillospiraceae bacterium]
MALNYNNEQIGISAEVAIAKEYNININPLYEARADFEIVNYLRPTIKRIFLQENIPNPVKHIAENQNAVDFLLLDGATLSVKTNQSGIGRAAPQIIGQASSNTYFNYLRQIFPNFDVLAELDKNNLEDTYENRAKIFKRISIEQIDTMINIYWKNIFDCDFLILFYNIVLQDGSVCKYPKYRVFGKKAVAPKWETKEFSFTKTIETWKESCTLKYKKITIGNFQVHKNRNCFKFRFDMKGLLYLINNGLL